jgi:hypothetical protein
LSQGTKSVDEYFKKIELAMIQANVEKDRDVTMTRFMNDLNNDIAHIIELHMVYMTIKVEKHLKQRGTIRQSQPLGLRHLRNPFIRLTPGVFHHN